MKNAQTFFYQSTKVQGPAFFRKLNFISKTLRYRCSILVKESEFWNLINLLYEKGEQGDVIHQIIVTIFLISSFSIQKRRWRTLKRDLWNNLHLFISLFTKQRKNDKLWSRAYQFWRDLVNWLLSSLLMLVYF